MQTTRVRVARCVLVALALQCGCGSTREPIGVDLDEWTLEGHPVALADGPGPLLSNGPGDYELVCEVALPPSMQGRELTLTLPLMDAFASLRVGEETLRALDSSPFDRVRPTYRKLEFRIPPRATGGSTLPLVLQVHGPDSTTRWPGALPRLSVGAYGERSSRLALVVGQLFVAGAAFVFALLATASAVLFGLRRRAVSGWYALLTASLVVWNLTLLGVTQLVDARDLVHVPLVTSTVACVASIGFLHSHFELGRAPRWVFATVLLLGTGAVASSWRRGSSMDLAGLLLTVMILVTLVFVAWKLGGLARRAGPRRAAAATMLAAWLLVGVGSVLNPVFAFPISPIAWMVFVLTQAVLLVREQTQTLRTLNMTLAVRVSVLEERTRDVAQLNDELRRQVGDRSARLAEALSRIGQLTAPAPLEVGVTLNDRYRIVRPLGEGGMGAVYEVVRTTDGRSFALKTLTHAKSGSSLARLAREAEAAARVTHPNLVAILDIDVTASGVLFLVMELVRGTPLSEESAHFGEISWATNVLRQVATGLSVLHAAGVVHRDLKPANVLLERAADGTTRAKIADFGIARVAPPLLPATPGDVDVDAPTQAEAGQLADAPTAPAVPGGRAGGLTETGAVVGTPMYIAPELSKGTHDAPASSDMWSFGVLAYELVTGHHPFEQAPIYAAARRQPWAPPADAASLPSPFGDLVARCMDPDPARRPSAGSVAEALARPSVEGRGPRP